MSTVVAFLISPLPFVGVGISIGSSSPSGSSPPVPPVPLLVVLAAVLLADVVLAAVLLADVLLADVLLADVLLVVVLLELLPPPLAALVLPPLATELLLELLPPWPSSGVAASSEQPSWEAPAAPITSNKEKADCNPNLISLPLVLDHDGRPAARKRSTPAGGVDPATRPVEGATTNPRFTPFSWPLRPASASRRMQAPIQDARRSFGPRRGRALRPACQRDVDTG
ncbi:hypothetical protein WME79_19180 [Sorangium sp. So ce726]|uniref:hypothetical protein n=1 Tax=Sorangium sp. So ce726 TaxID=3133319 RepID=UPI003F604D63